MAYGLSWDEFNNASGVELEMLGRAWAKMQRAEELRLGHAVAALANFLICAQLSEDQMKKFEPYTAEKIFPDRTKKEAAAEPKPKGVPLSQWIVVEIERDRLNRQRYWQERLKRVQDGKAAKSRIDLCPSGTDR